MSWTTVQAGDCQLACVYCGETGRFPRALSYEHGGETLSLYRCPSCESLAYDISGEQTTRPTMEDDIGPEVWRAARYVLEAGFSARHVVQCALAALPDLSAERIREFTFVDIGAGFGMASYFVKTTFGMPTITVEPSYTGKLSTEILGLPIHRVYFEELPQEVLAELATRPCCLHLNSVVEHLVDPFTTLQGMLAATRVQTIALIVPDAAFLDEKLPFVTALPFLSPHDHHHLPTKTGIERFLQRLGFEHTWMSQDPGLLTAVGSKTAFAFPSERTIGMAERVLGENLLRHHNPHIVEGAVGRLIPIAILNGNEQLLQYLRGRAPYEEHAAEYLRRIGAGEWEAIPFHLGPTCYWLALDALKARRIDGALSLLAITTAFADLIAKDHPDLALTSVHFKWPALLLRADILSGQGQVDAARDILAGILASASDPNNGAGSSHRSQAWEALIRIPPSQAHDTQQVIDAREPALVE